MKTISGQRPVRSCLVAAVLLAAGAGGGFAADAPAAGHDWPMWRCDAGRTAATEEELPAALQLQWVRRYPELQPAWTGVRDLSFEDGTVYGASHDDCIGFEVIYSPVVLGRTMFVASPHNDSLTAIDLETGAEKWRFYAEGPMRLAPAAWKDKVYAVSDDGFLYCLSAADGKLLWKFRGAPMRHRVLGDERLVSAWPARGGPVVAPSTGSGQVTVYFAASIFPLMGLYIYALDAESGKQIWVNDSLGGNAWMQPYGNQGKPGNQRTAPQGPLAVVGDRLLVPNNRLLVTALDRNTGKFLFWPSSSGGTSHWRTGGAGDYFVIEGRFGRGAELYELQTGKAFGQLTGMPVLSGGSIYWAGAGSGGNRAVCGGEATRVGPTAANMRIAGDIPSKWTFKPKVPNNVKLEVRIRAGSRLYVSAGKKIFALDLPAAGGEPKESWSADLEAEIGDVLAAAGRLVVVTRDGGIHCFGAEKAAAKTYPLERRELPAASDAWTEKAGWILKASGAGDGYALVLGVGSGRLMEELLKQSRLAVIGVDPDALRVDALRRRLDAAGLYGKRAQVIVGDPLDCGLPQYLAELIVCEDSRAAGIAKGAAFEGQVFRSLRPYGGTLCLSSAEASKEAVEGWARESKSGNAQVSSEGDLTLLRRAGALPGSDTWTHQFAGPGNTVCSADDLVRGPLGLLWFGGPSGGAVSFDRHYAAPRPQVVGGRLLILGPKAITATDVYTGRLLWQAKLPGITDHARPYMPATGYEWRGVGSNMWGSPWVSLPDGIYVALGRTCFRLDPRTGATASEIHLPADGKPAGYVFGPIRIWEDVLVAAAAPFRENPEAKADKQALVEKGGNTACRELVAFDRNSGKVLWSFAAEGGIPNNAVAVGDGKVFVLDRLTVNAQSGSQAGRLSALDVRTGKAVWTSTETVFGNWLAHSPKTGVLLRADYGGRGGFRATRGIAYDARTGKAMWDEQAGLGPWLLNGDRLINQGWDALDIRTGRRVADYKKIDGKACNYVIGGPHVLAARQFTNEYVDIDTNTAYLIGGVRTGCMNALIPADGVLNSPYMGTGCFCDLNIRASMALVHMPELGKKEE